MFFPRPPIEPLWRSFWQKRSHQHQRKEAQFRLRPAITATQMLRKTTKKCAKS